MEEWAEKVRAKGRKNKNGKYFRIIVLQIQNSHGKIHISNKKCWKFLWQTTI